MVNANYLCLLFEKALRNFFSRLVGDWYVQSVKERTTFSAPLPLNKNIFHLLCLTSLGVIFSHIIGVLVALSYIFQMH